MAEFQDLPPTPGAAIVPELMTTAEVAKLISAGGRTVWRWSRSGVMPAPVKLGSGPRAAVRFRRGEIVDWINAGCPSLSV
jgi:predicted DNA-binding transcriptional regulator AlpA